MNERIIYRKPQAEIDKAIANGELISEYAVVIPTGDITMDELVKSLPEGVTNVRVTTINDIPSDRTFRDAWDDSNPEPHIGVNIDKAKEISHGKRRAKREEEFKPHDEVIAKQIPGADATIAENARQEIRNKYDQIQLDIDNAVDETELKTILETNGIV